MRTTQCHTAIWTQQQPASPRSPHLLFFLIREDNFLFQIPILFRGLRPEATSEVASSQLARLI